MTPTLRLTRDDWADAAIALPAYETPGAAGADVRANLRPEDRAAGLTLAPMARMIVPPGA